MNKDFHHTQKSAFRTLIKPSRQSIKLQQPSNQKLNLIKNPIKNIFTSPVYSDKPTYDPNQTFYSVVGDTDFKEKYFNKTLFTNQSLTQQTQNGTVRTFFYNPTKLSQKARQKHQSMYHTKQFNETTKDEQTTAFMPKLLPKAQMNNTVFSAWNKERSCDLKKIQLNETKTIDRDTIMRKLSLNQQLRSTRDQRSMQKFTQYKSGWQIQDKKIMTLNRRSSTVMKDSFKNIYSFPNPEKQQLINDNIPQYWRQSLRNNNKRLKYHIKGNQFKNEIAEQMLQTIKGTKRIEKSMQRIPQQYIGFKHQTMNNKIRLRGTKFIEKNISITKKNQELQSFSNMFTPLEEVHKINYDHQNKWMGIQGI